MIPHIRLVTPSDVASIHAIYAPFCEDSAVSFELQAPTLVEMQQRVARISQQFPWLVCEYEQEIAGFAYASPHRERSAYCWSVDVSIYVHAKHQRKGVGRSLYTSLFKTLALQGYYKAHAGITLPNPSSVGLHEALGFQLIGVYHGVGYKLGCWRDVGWWQLALQPEQPDPASPRSIRDIQATPALDEALQAGLPLLR
jgi:phosphinothricin acetyltransferase